MLCYQVHAIPEETIAIQGYGPKSGITDVVLDVHPTASTVTLDLPYSNIFPTFHISLVKPFCPNDNEAYPHWAIDDQQEFFVESIIDHRIWGRGHQYLVKFQGYPDTYNRWISGKELEGDSALVDYLSSLPQLP